MADISNNKSFCTRLWTHLMFECNGDVSPCCLMHSRRNWDSPAKIGNANTSTLEELWNSPLMKQTRMQMLKGEEVELCGKCYDKEAANVNSARQYFNKYFAHKIDKVFEETKPDGTYEDIDLVFWDVRFSNKCNFKCRMCGPASSSAWVADKRKMTTDAKLIRGLTQHENIDGKKSLEFLKDNAHKVERILFAGGEPLIMDEHYQLLEYLIENKNFCMISYHTNLSKLQYKSWNVLDMWSKWPIEKVVVMPSIDEIGDRAELIRSGTVWIDIERNIKAIRATGIKMLPNITVNAMNINRLPEVITYLYENGVITDKYKCLNFTVSNVYWPKHMQINILPDWFKTETKTKLLKFFEDFKVRTGWDITNKIAFQLEVLDQPQNKEQAVEFIKYTAKLDEIRGESTYDVIPELKCVK